MAIGVTGPLLIVLLISLGLMIWALVDLLRYPTSTYERAEQNQLVWALIVVFVGVVGPIIYLVVGRPRLRAAHDLTPLA